MHAICCTALYNVFNSFFSTLQGCCWSLLMVRKNFFAPFPSVHNFGFWLPLGFSFLQGARYWAGHGTIQGCCKAFQGLVGRSCSCTVWRCLPDLELGRSLQEAFAVLPEDPAGCVYTAAVPICKLLFTPVQCSTVMQGLALERQCPSSAEEPRLGWLQRGSG